MLFLQVVKGPVTKHLPADSNRIGFSRTAPNVSTLQEFADELEDDTTPVFVVGAHAHGKVVLLLLRSTLTFFLPIPANPFKATVPGLHGKFLSFTFFPLPR